MYFLPIIDFGLAAFLIFFSFRVRFRVASSINSRLISLYGLAAAVVSLGLGGAYAGAIARNSSFALGFAKLAGAASVGSFIIMAILAFTFPFERRRLLLRRLALILWLVAAWAILFTDRYLRGVTWEAGEFFRDIGPWYHLISGGGFLLGLLSVAVLLIRRASFSGRMYRLQAAVVSGGVALGYLVSYFLAIIAPLYYYASWTYPLMGISATLIALTLAYGLSITRPFDIRSVLASSALYIALSVVMAAAAGLLYAGTAVPLARNFPVLGFLVGMVVFVAVYLVDYFIRNRSFRLIRGRGAYSERLEEALSDLDFSLGRDEIIRKTISLLAGAIDTPSVQLLIETPEGDFVNVGSTTGSSETFDRHGEGVEHLMNQGSTIVFKTEVLTSHEYLQFREELLAIYERFDADALVLLREGRSLLSAVLIGAKRNGSDLTSYDYDTLSRIYGKLFVIAYYLKNVAQESLVLTVDREVEFSDQIVQSIQENIDKVSHPSVDLSYLTRSTRKLGGDFIDFVRVSRDRFLFVMGDVSGKGLNASMSMVILKSMLRTFLKETKDFKGLVVKANAFIKSNLPRGTFFAGVVGLFDFAETSLYYINCGVPLMFLLSSAYNNPVEIQGDGKVLGFVSNIAPYVSVRKASFKAGDILLMTTDGLTDAESVRGARFGKERIQKSLFERRTQSADRIVRGLVDDVKEFVSDELEDDITIVAIKFLQR